MWHVCGTTFARLDAAAVTTTREHCTVKVRDVLRDLEAHGWYVHRQRGSHRVLRHRHRPDRRVVLAGNEGTEVPTGTLAAIYRQADLDPPARRGAH